MSSITPRVSTRNVVWLAVIVTVGVLAGAFLGWAWSLAGMVAVLVVSEVVERRRRSTGTPTP